MSRGHGRNAIGDGKCKRVHLLPEGQVLSGDGQEHSHWSLQCWVCSFIIVQLSGYIFDSTSSSQLISFNYISSYSLFRYTTVMSGRYIIIDICARYTTVMSGRYIIIDICARKDYPLLVNNCSSCSSRQILLSENTDL